MSISPFRDSTDLGDHPNPEADAGECNLLASRNKTRFAQHIPRRDSEVGGARSGSLRDGPAGFDGCSRADEERPSVCVLEARDRVGGRTLDHAIGGGHVVEGEGQWVGPGQTRVLALVKDLGLTTFRSDYQGRIVLSVSGLRFTRPTDEADLADVSRVKRLLDGLAETVPIDAPWSAEHARIWDAKTVADWLAENTRDEETKQVFEIDISTELGSSSKVSLPYYLFIIRSAGGPSRS